MFGRSCGEKPWFVDKVDSAPFASDHQTHGRINQHYQFERGIATHLKFLIQACGASPWKSSFDKRTGFVTLLQASFEVRLSSLLGAEQSWSTSYDEACFFSCFFHANKNIVSKPPDTHTQWQDMGRLFGVIFLPKTTTFNTFHYNHLLVRDCDQSNPKADNDFVSFRTTAEKVTKNMMCMGREVWNAIVVRNTSRSVAKLCHILKLDFFP